MKICYITAIAPCGNAESFVLREADALKKIGAQIFFAPVRPQALSLQEREYQVWRCGMFSLKCISFAIYEFFRKPIKSLRAMRDMLDGVTVRAAIKNLMVFPKALATAYYIENNLDIDVIHAHWLTTPSTVAYIASALTGIPFGITGHRWDIFFGNNAIKQKVEKSHFVRIINKNGARYIRDILPMELRKKVTILHMGANILERPPIIPRTKIFRLATVANLVEQKGHRYILEALLILKNAGITAISLSVYGEGSLSKKLKNMTSQYGIDDIAIFEGHIPNSSLIDKYRSGEIHCVILASYEKSESDVYEGIPFSLIEAMAHGVPVIATDLQGISELTEDECGVVVRQRNAQDIADAIVSLMNDAEYTSKITANGYSRVCEQFNDRIIARELISIMEKASHDPKD